MTVMAETQQQPQLSLTPVGKPLSLIPVVIKEAALDSPTFRSTAVHYGEQIDIIEKWLESHIKSASKLAQEVAVLEILINNILASSAPPPQATEAIMDHDYTLLALKRYGEGMKEFWTSTLKGMRRTELIAVEPIRAFLQNDLKGLKEARKSLDQAQRYYDRVISQYSSQAKTKEASSIREDAFQLHEARKAYLKASMDFCTMAPVVRCTLDKILVRALSEQWRDMKSARDASSNFFTKLGSDMERIRGWGREMENGEKVFKRELLLARKQIEESAELSIRPSRELDDYASSTVPYLGNKGPSTTNIQNARPQVAEPTEKQGWLFHKTLAGKPSRTVWVRRWFYVKHGIFGYLEQGIRSGAVEESEKVGVLLCGVRPAFTEERRFCFEVKTKDATTILQAETQSELVGWISAFELAKRKALEEPSNTENQANNSQSSDPAFSIIPPVAPEFAIRPEGNVAHLNEEHGALERADTLAVTDREGIGSLASRSSFDVTRRGANGEREESGRDHAARIIQKLDLHRKATSLAQLTTGSPAPAGGIASLISASLASASGTVAPLTIPSQGSTTPDLRTSTVPTTSLAPSTLAIPPTPTNSSRLVVFITSERGLGLGKSDGGMPSGLMANTWGSTNWGYINRLERGEVKTNHERSISSPPSPHLRFPPSSETGDKPATSSPEEGGLPGTTSPPSQAHRKTISLSGVDVPRLQTPKLDPEEFPPSYPLPLKAQEAQFRLLFPNVPRDDKVVLVCRAVWNPTEQQEFPGRIYVTTQDIYFYSNHMGLVLVTGLGLDKIEEVTAAPGRDCDFLFLHFKEGARQDGSSRLTIKTFLEPLKLLQRRLNFLVRNRNSDAPLGLDEIVKKLLKMESDDMESPSLESWEDISIQTPTEGPNDSRSKEFRLGLRIDGRLHAGAPGSLINKNATKFKLPTHPVVYAPQGMTALAAEKEFHVSAKSLFHVLFGDKSAVFPILYRERWARKITLGPWTHPDQSLQRRDFVYEVDPEKLHQKNPIHIDDYQVIEVLNDHLCYVVTDKKTPWHLPYSNRFRLVTKMVITHVSKSRCKLAIYTKVAWEQSSGFLIDLVEKRALEDLSSDALDLIDIISEQADKLGKNSSTRRATQIFGHLGLQKQAVSFSATDIPIPPRPRRFKLQQISLRSLVIGIVWSAFLRILNTILGFFSSMLQSIVKVCTAHSIVVMLLLLSAGTNIFYSSKNSKDWWIERRAGKFMARVGVHPDVMMTRGIYLRDVDDIIQSHNINLTSSDSPCMSSFADIVNDSNPSILQAKSSSTTKRLHRTRQNLASYRHDLLVSLRVVNSVEREVLKAEYENFLMEENMRCNQAKRMLHRKTNSPIATDNSRIYEKEGKESQHVLGSPENESDNDVSGWLTSYCRSCKVELESLVGEQTN